MYEVTTLGNKNLTIPQEKSKLLRIDREIAAYLNKDEVALLLSVVTNKKHYLLIDLLWKTGVRVTEAVSIKKGDIDFYNQTIKIRWLKHRKAKERIIPLHQSLAYQLSVYASNMGGMDKIFDISRQRVFQILKRYAKTSQIQKNVHPHTLRHSFAIHFLNETGNVIMLKELLGHSQITTTMAYLKYVQKDIKEAIQGINF
jgi:integrase/recombinase XerD